MVAELGQSLIIVPGHEVPGDLALKALDRNLSTSGENTVKRMCREAEFNVERAIQLVAGATSSENRYVLPLQYLFAQLSWSSLGSEWRVPTVVAGHSLGEFAALAIARSISWTDGLRLVMRCGLMMDVVQRLRPGAMLAVLGLPRDKVEDLCNRVQVQGPGYINIANVNGPQQIVISGDACLISCLEHELFDDPMARALRLNINGYAHSRVYAPLSPMKKALQNAEILDPEIDVYLSTTGGRVTSAHEVEGAIEHILDASVDWVSTLRHVHESYPLIKPELLYANRSMYGLLRKIYGHRAPRSPLASSHGRSSEFT